MTASTNGASTRRLGVDPGLDKLCQTVVQLAKDLPSPVQRLSLHVGECAVDVEFAAQPPFGAQAQAVTDIEHLPAAAQPDGADSGTTVRSELVGTFFTATAPGAEPFVHLGDRVDEGQQLGIVEAMKLMNPVLAPCAGKVLQIHACDGQSVEYDQVLITFESDESF